MIGTKHLNLVMMPEKPKIENTWELQAFCDSNYAGARDGCKSISGFIINVQSCPISWKFKKQNTVILSSNRAEYVAVSDVCTEIVF
jgi:hypothetical protein